MPTADSVLPRALGRRFAAALNALRVVVVTGPRQAGKSTFVRTHPATADRPYVTLDDPAIRLRIAADPMAFLRSEPTFTIDEVQREPDLLLAVKMIVDVQHPMREGQFVLTGSANLLMMKTVADSLAGRAAYLRLWPLARREQLGLGSAGMWTALFETPAEQWLDLLRADPAPAENWRDAVRRGGFPATALHAKTDEARDLWYEGYVAMYLERDLRDLRVVHDLQTFRSLMQAAALRIGNLVNIADLARDVRLAPTTVSQYINLLETSYQMIRLFSYGRNRTTRLIKTPKLYWNDAGLALHLAGGEPTGAHFENAILCDLLAWRETEPRRVDIFYWRTAGGAEVDFVVERGNQLLAVEVKGGIEPAPRDATHLRDFLETYGDPVVGGLILHGGDQAYWLRDRILAAPWWMVV